MLFAAGPLFAQYEDMTSLPDAPTRTAEQKNVICTLEGVQVIKKTNDKGTKDVSLGFLLTEKPSVYFNYYDPKKKALVFDFYDTRIGESILDTIREAPIIGSNVEALRIDLNKDVEGLQPDIRDVVRVSLYSQYDFEYDVQEDVGVITLSFKWSSKKETQLKRKNTMVYWQVGLGLLAAAAAGVVAYELWLKKDETGQTDPLKIIPGHPQE